MDVLSAIPKGIVLAMQVALAALLVLAVVPLATGGLDISDIETEPPDYRDGVISFSAAATVNANLYFDITGFGYTVSVISGDERMIISEEPGIPISRKGATDIDIRAEIPVTTVMMMLLLGAVTEDHETRIELTVRGSTMSGMISASAQIDLFVPTVADADENIVLTTDKDDIVSMTLNLKTGVLSDILAVIPDHLEIDIGGTVITFSISTADGETYITIDWEIDDTVLTPVDGLIDGIEKAIADGGDDGIYIDIAGIGVPVHLTKEQAQFIVEVLKIILGAAS